MIEVMKAGLISDDGESWIRLTQLCSLWIGSYYERKDEQTKEFCTVMGATKITQHLLQKYATREEARVKLREIAELIDNENL